MPGFMAIASNKYVLMAASILIWTALVGRFAYNSGYDKADAECKEAIIAAQNANIEVTQWKLDNQKAQYELQVQAAREVAENERQRAIRLRRAITDIQEIDAPDCTAVPDEWVQSVREAFGDRAD